MCLKNNACWLYLRNIVYSMDTASRRFYFMCYCYKIVYLLRAASCAFKAAISEIIAFFSERTAAISASFSDIRESFSDIRESFSERAASFSDIRGPFQTEPLPLHLVPFVVHRSYSELYSHLTFEVLLKTW